MNVKKLVLTSAIALGALTGYAQQAEDVVVYDFVPTWYVQGQIGGQETLGEGSFGDLLSPNVQLSVGRQLNPLFGVRFGVNGAWSKGVMPAGKWFVNDEAVARKEGKWTYNYLAPMLDGTFNLTNAFGGYNPFRLYDINLIGGIGLNVGFGNGDANDYNKTYPGVLENIWSGTKVRLTGRLGLGCDFRLTDEWKLGVELTANLINDNYNSKKAYNADWYFNGLVGVKYTFGSSYNKRVIPAPEPVKEIIRETVVERVVEPAPPAPAPRDLVEQVAPVQSFERNVFFLINQSVIRPQEMTKVAEIADYMKSHPNSTVHITGYADKGTGTLAINLRLARERAAVVVKTLINKYGISADRITSSSMTESLFQPFEEPVKNRVAICVVE